MNPALLPFPPGEGWGEGKRRTAAPIVLDTNIILDVFVFNDLRAETVRQALAGRELDWLATQPMRDELERVLAYPKIATRLAFYKLNAADVLAKFD
jgi:predicted nucleic acid-binding protein